jgi:endogenous inhibitor of DNA gyrase (YacG/DUF329 family)
MPEFRCPVCQKPFDPEQSRTMPFCSERCKLIDLGRWLDEKHGLPLEPEDKEPNSPAKDEGRE